MATVVRTATKADLPGMAVVYVAAFPESIEHFFGRRAPTAAMADLLAIPLAAEPNSVFVAEVDQRIAGYCLAPAHFSRIARTALRCTFVWRYVWRWLTGQYGLGLRPLRMLALDKLRGHRERRHDRHHSEAHILSIAVHPEFQRLGLGRALLERGLAYLDSTVADPIRLEVRPGNAPALNLYEKYGFRTVGRTSDSQGDWVIMLRSTGSEHDLRKR